MHLPELLSATSTHRPVVSTYPCADESEGVLCITTSSFYYLDVLVGAACGKDA